MAARIRNPEDKLPRIVAAEEEARKLRATTARHPHDRIPIKLHSRSLSDSGVPDLAEALLRYLSGEHARTLHDQHMEVVLMELQRLNRPLWTLLEEHYFYKQSYRQIAEQMQLSEHTVRGVIARGILDIQARLVELFGQNA